MAYTMRPGDGDGPAGRLVSGGTAQVAGERPTLDNTDGLGRTRPAWDPSLLLQLPRPQAVHTGWDASNVSTAKCDMCHRQRCGVIQKCSECKLSVCKDCALADRLRDDRRHLLNPDAVEWDTHKLPKGRRVRAARGAAAKGTRTGGQNRSMPCGNRGGGTQLRSGLSHETSSSLSATASPQTDDALPTADDRWEVDYAEPEASARGAVSPHNRRMKRPRTAASPMQSEDAAQILADMPLVQGRSKRRNLPPLNSLHLLSSGHGSLPSLNSLQLPLNDDGVGTRQALPKSVPTPRQAPPVALMGQTPTVPQGVPQQLASNGPVRVPVEAQLTRDQYPYPAQQQQLRLYDEGQPAGSFYPPLTSPSAEQPGGSYAAAPMHNDDADAHAAGAHGQQCSGQDGRAAPGYGLALPSTYPADGSAVATPGAMSYGFPAQPTGQSGYHDALPAPSAQVSALKAATLQIKHSEHPDWPVVYCLRLAVQRIWSLAIINHAGGLQRRQAIQQLVADTDCATRELQLPENYNAASDWARDEARRLTGYSAQPPTRLPVSGFLSTPHQDAQQ